jgi:hypothetical protein
MFIFYRTVDRPYAPYHTNSKDIRYETRNNSTALHTHALPVVWPSLVEVRDYTLLYAQGVAAIGLSQNG